MNLRIVTPENTRALMDAEQKRLEMNAYAAGVAEMESYYESLVAAAKALPAGTAAERELRSLRISYAVEYLESGFYNVESVAAMCGFRESKYFSTVFKRIKGVTPSEYIKRRC